MAFRVSVDPQVCEGHGQCFIEAPNIFEMDDDGYAQAVSESVDDELAPKVEQAVRACPAGAVVITR
ncbi:ferredoxin [Rhodococcus wratislaviensis]|uniref:Ferredoxin n=1 Tax=Rhodococcus wratislaviensis NBRC 100605 TaxID=1219028 RepID=X0PWA0_RHOWR|nr:ferredoxin [Rhodococcus wratislaviensis]GAF47624.1 putative 3Fe-4S ferredoxin [Rhodococcus wratislaviensis NBRC 100605]